jgi:hypothetical protein
MLDVRPLHDRAEAGPERRRADVLRGDVASGHIGHDHADPRPRDDLAAVDQRAVGHVFRGDERLQHRHVEVGTLAGLQRADERREDRSERVGGGEHVGGLQIAHPRRRLAVALQVHEPRHRVDDVREGGPVRQRPRLSEAGDRAVHEPGVDRAQRRRIDAEPGRNPGEKIFDRDIGMAGEIVRDRPAVRMRQIDGHALLARVDPDEIRGLVIAVVLELKVPAAHLVAFAGTLDLDHAGAEIREQACAIRPGQHTREVQHGDAFE